MGKTTSASAASSNKKSATNVTPTKGTKKTMSIRGSRVYSQDQRYIQNIDCYKTLVDDLVISVASKPGDSPVGSYTFPMMKKFNDPSHGERLASEWGILGFFPRREPSSSDGEGEVMRTPPTTQWVWHCFVSIKKEGQTIENVGRKIARGFSRFTRNQAISEMSKPESYAFRSASTQDPPKPLSHYLLDGDCARLLRTLYSNFKKEDLMEDNELMEAFFGNAKKGKGTLDGMDDDEWEDLLDD